MVSQNSGLFELLEARMLENRVFSVDVRGGATPQELNPDDISAVAGQVLAIARATRDLRFTKPLLYRLSYAGAETILARDDVRVSDRFASCFRINASLDDLQMRRPPCFRRILIPGFGVVRLQLFRRGRARE